MTYLHASNIRYHGNLNSRSCVIDSRFVLKVTDFGLQYLRDFEFDERNESKYSNCKENMYRPAEAPRYFRDKQKMSFEKGSVKTTRGGKIYHSAKVVRALLAFGVGAVCFLVDSQQWNT